MPERVRPSALRSVAGYRVSLFRSTSAAGWIFSAGPVTLSIARSAIRLSSNWASARQMHSEAFLNVHRFVFEKFIHLEGGGEWYALLDRDGRALWDYLGHAWKISYHTVRSMIQVCHRLRRLAERAAGT